MADLRVAVISDIHGNRGALKAVLDDIRRRGIHEIINLGDSLYGPLDPVGTARLLIESRIPSIRGNEDRILLEPPGPSGDPRIMEYVQSLLTSDHMKWLETLPATSVAFGDLFLCHGTPERDDKYLLVEVTEEGIIQRRGDALSSMLTPVSQEVVLCGHDHTPRTVRLPDSRLVIDPGSVGLPAYTDVRPFPHAVETGSPHARYVISAKSEIGWRAEHIEVTYDWDAAAAAARERGFADWAPWLKTGRARKECK